MVFFDLLANMSGIRFIGNSFSDPGALFQENYISLNSFTLYSCLFERININGPGVLDTCGPFVQCPGIDVSDIINCTNFIICGYIVALNANNCQGFMDCAGVSIAAATGCSLFMNCDILLFGTANNVFSVKNVLSCSHPVI